MGAFQALFCCCLLLTACVGRQAGILYEVWHSRASDAMRTVADKGGKQLNTELVIQSNGTHTLNDVYGPYGLGGDIYNVKPALGYYCLYRARPGDVPPYVPTPPMRDCLNITHTAQTHASMLIEAGFDYVAVDVTNWPMFNYTTDRGGSTDVAVMRPTEVLFEEWGRMQAQGVGTPAIAPWVCSPKGSTSWRYFLDRFYNDPTASSLIYRRPSSNNNTAFKMVFFVPATPDCMDPDVVKLIESNGGRNNIEVIQMWALFGGDAYARGTWGFFSPCRAPDGSYTTSMVDVGPCNQPETTVNGTVMEVSASGGYMVAQCALPYGSPGHLRGLTLQRLFERVLAVGAPDLFMSSFNEHIGGREGPASPAKIAFNMGLPTDPQREVVWVDTYAAEFSRDIEPSVEGGGRVWEVASTCVGLYKLGLTCADIPVELNACCSTADKFIWANVWSLVSKDGGDHLLTNDGAERRALVDNGSFREICAAIANPTAFCVDTADPDGRSGPFYVYNTADVGLPTVTLYRCYTGTAHFVSRDVRCEGLGQKESVLGYGAARPGLEMLRALRRCVTPTGSRTHALDLACDTPDRTWPGVLAYVR